MLPMRRVGRSAKFFQAARRSVLAAGTVVWIYLVSSADAASIRPPANLGQLVLDSETVVLARALDSTGIARGMFIETETTFVVEETIAGPLEVGEHFRARVPGGKIGERMWVVDGSPKFERGAAYLLCLARRGDSSWTPSCLSYGVLRELSQDASGQPLEVPQLTPLGDTPWGSAATLRVHKSFSASPFEAVGVYDEAMLLDHLRNLRDGSEAWNSRSAGVIDRATIGGVPKGANGLRNICATFEDFGVGLRWRAFDPSAGFPALIATQQGGDESLPGGGFRETVDAMNLWMDIPGSGLNLLLAAEGDSGIRCTAGIDTPSKSFIVFNDVCNDIPDLDECRGVLAFGGPLVNGSHTFNGHTWLTIDGWIVVMNDGVGCIGSANYTILVAHELGHGLGYDHIEDDGALMFSLCCNAPNATDIACAQALYPAPDPLNLRPTVDVTSAEVIGNVATLEAVANDEGGGDGLTISWEQVSGPGFVEFSDQSSLNTDASFTLRGTYVLTVTASDGELLRSDSVSLTLTTEQFIRGDSDENGTLDITDAIRLFTFLFDGGAAESTMCLDSGDADDNGAIDISDPIRILNFLFGGPQTPPQLREVCDSDLTPDALGVCFTAFCE